MKATLIIIGDEILIGQVTDTNTGTIARALAPAGCEVSRVMTIGDKPAQIRAAVTEALGQADDSELVITTGGLGPTKDDITKKVLADITGGSMTLHQPSLDNVERVLSARGLKVNELSRLQAMVPDSCTPIVNRCGTAPIMWFDTHGKTLVAMPGVPFETVAALEHDIVPRIMERNHHYDVAVRRHILLEGISESDVAERIAGWEEQLPEGFHLAYLPNNGYLRLRLDGHGQDPEMLAQHADALASQLAGILDGHVWATADLTPAQALLQELTDARLTVASAESCTGGKISALLTAIPGSSKAVAGGIVAYSNDAKHNLLGVESDTLARYGAVSEQTVTQMALGTCRAFGSDMGIATSGIAGPTGAVPGKPVGTVCIAVALLGMVSAFTVHLPGDRARVTSRAANTAMISALRMLRTSRMQGRI